MTIYKDLYGQKEERDNKGDVFSYDKIPPKVRTKLFYIIFDDFNWSNCPSGQKGADLSRVRFELCKNLGLPRLNNYTELGYCFNVWFQSCDIKKLIWTIEIFCEVKARSESNFCTRSTLSSIKSQINNVFALDLIGYEIVNNRIIKKDTEYLHKEVIKKALNLLYDEDFKSAEDEFETALTKYAKNDLKGALISANSSFESAMKIILGKKGAAKNLIPELLKFELNRIVFIPKYFVGYLESLKKILQIIPIIRSEEAAHGQGGKKKMPSKEMVQFVIHQTGAVLVFLVNRFNELKKNV